LSFSRYFLSPWYSRVKSASMMSPFLVPIRRMGEIFDGFESLLAVFSS